MIKTNKTGTRPAGLLGRFLNDRRGNVAVMFGLLAVPLIALVGAAIDYSEAHRAKARVQAALDAASLSVNRSMDTMTDAELRDLARDVFNANMGGEYFDAEISDENIVISDEDRTVTITAEATIDTNFISILGFDHIDFGPSSTTKAGEQTFEIAMVLDNSGSMAGSKISDLREAAEALTDTVFADEETSEVVRMSVVPFAGAVNVGTGNANAAWMDTEAISPVHRENFDPDHDDYDDLTRFDLFEMMDDTEWAGCVEARPEPYDVDDTPASAGIPETMFVPMFAPDEPDDCMDPDDYWCDHDEVLHNEDLVNNYLDDEMDYDDKDDFDWDEAQGDLDKYDDEEPDTSAGGWGLATDTGPNFMCDADPIVPLTNVHDTIVDAIDDMGAKGYTNIHMGLMWGWRTLSPGAPFTEGMDYDEINNNKVIILMTDGENKHIGSDSPNDSAYSAYGFASNGRLRSPTSTTWRLEEAMNERTADACENAKDQGIRVYTIAFDVDEDSPTHELLRDCASTANNYYAADDGDDLIDTFEEIGKELAKLRITK